MTARDPAVREAMANRHSAFVISNDPLMAIELGRTITPGMVPLKGRATRAAVPLRGAGRESVDAGWGRFSGLRSNRECQTGDIP